MHTTHTHTRMQTHIPHTHMYADTTHMYADTTHTHTHTYTHTDTLTRVLYMNYNFLVYALHTTHPRPAVFDTVMISYSCSIT